MPDKHSTPSWMLGGRLHGNVLARRGIESPDRPLEECMRLGNFLAVSGKHWALGTTGS
eukprot:CAMPEP_0172744014 /NCGR_PEP_ID=MMETSP1074-20121228/133984_1 /TAXON_ID=2916 /ORGANISM="Ceratium fusus, Strain PA161109" /LENGTH=57 /DNA_ID=CAMNT_0013574867 /DNA_START=132 /DNA_END=302 /DNA_ORIENTATION=-